MATIHFHMQNCLHVLKKSTKNVIEYYFRSFGHLKVEVSGEKQLFQMDIPATMIIIC
jgi:hypothetical protein